ncbi:DUF1365 domain-containing protein [Gordonia sp. X0973]|uniref:DUF1365 domain-containing protein n=1 Tax=Gordonia sp. X0973 TaxID=2742602 RepID=UPI000F53FE1C|nr:DUF1365 domain-containing protein [Gordonia sp. X0973]QKT08049.1 DUF1365 domain-containing protein [Gordonia sp. X0973]
MSPDGTVLPAIVDAQIVHSRTDPIVHRFAYRSRTWLIDIDDLPDLPGPLRPFARFRAADHFPEPLGAADTLRGRLESHLRAAGVEPPTGRITALMSPRVAGYVFNPLSVYWCHTDDGALAYVVAEVHNTYGGRHCYVVDVDSAGRASVDKQFHVSPFHDMSGRYDLRLPEPDPGGNVSLSIVLSRPGAAPFTASLRGRALPATARRVALTQLTAPLAPLVVALRIRIQGLALWRRRLPITPPPDQHQHTTVATDHVTARQEEPR